MWQYTHRERLRVVVVVRGEDDARGGDKERARLRRGLGLERTDDDVRAAL
jgi:hypothetical protein